jgi:ribose transport system substrate-binding protein
MSIRQPKWLALVVVAGLLVNACVTITTNSDSAASPEATTAPTAATSAAPGTSSAPTREPGATRIGYISLDEAVPFARSVSESVRAAAANAGIELIECDSGLTPQGGLECGERLGAAGIDGLINFQAYPEIAADICDATGNVPTIGVAFDQGPCEISRLRLDQAESGRIAGDAMGRFAAARWDCKIDAYVSLEASAAGADATDRMAGYREGFERHCSIPQRADVTLDGADRVATARARFARTLRQRKGARIVVVGLNEDAVQGAMAAAAADGRADDVFYSGQGADPSVREDIACDPQYVASVAHFPERYGELAVPALQQAMAGQEVPAIIDGPMELVSATDIRNHYPEIPACLS